jgi:large subunit ribosomal protein L17
MRHGIADNRFGRNQKLRQATVRDLARATLKHERITTTHAKAKGARQLVDKLITLGKKNTLHAKRAAFAILIDHDLVSMLFNKIAPRFKDRQGGYTRLIKYAVNRQGDNAQMTLLELTEREAKVDPTAAKGKVVEAEVVEGKTSKAAKAPKKKAAVKKA